MTNSLVAANTVSTSVVLEQETAEEDFKVVIDNIKGAIELSQEVLTDVAQIAKQTAQPEHYTAFSSVLSTFISANKALVDIHKKEKDYKGKTKTAVGTVNNLFVGSTNELLDMIKKLETKKNEEHN